MKKRATLLALTLAAGCTGDPDTRPNVLPDFRPLPDQGRPDATGGAPGGGAVVPPGPEFPQAYRFECIHIDKLGENQPNGAPPTLEVGERRRAASSVRTRSSGDVLVNELVDSTDVPAADAGWTSPLAPAILASLRLITCNLLTIPVRQVVVSARINDAVHL
jgi:hypothetical protein